MRSKKVIATCPICGNSQTAKIGKPYVPSALRYNNWEEYNVFNCTNCRFYFVHPTISFSDDEWSQLYGKEYFSEMTAWWAKKRQKDRKERLDLLDKKYPGKINNFLDIGCGEGYVLMEAIDRGWNAFGVDISDNRIDEAKGAQTHFYQGTIFDMPIPDGFFNCIYIDSVLEHILDPVGFLNKINKIMSKNGVLYLGVPNEDSLFNDAKKIIRRILGEKSLSSRLKPFSPPYHVLGFTKESLKKIVTDCDYEIIRFRNFAGEYEWKKFKLFSKPFLINIILLPIHLIAILLERRIYLDVIAKKR